MRPLVSIIIPTYNRADVIERALNSVISQTYKNFEVIIVDDGSKDNTEEVVNNFIKKLKNKFKIQYIRLPKNYGANFARNYGIKLSEGDLIAFLDSDDIWLPKKLELQVKKMSCSKRNYGAVYTSFWRVYPNGAKVLEPNVNKYKKLEGNILKVLLGDGLAITSTLVVKRLVLEEVGMFDESLRRFQEWDLLIRISKRFEIGFVNQPLVISYVRKDSISTSTLMDFENHILRLVNKHREEYMHNKGALSNVYTMLATKLCSCSQNNNEFLKGVNYFRKAWLLSPFNLKALVGFVSAKFGKECYMFVSKLYHRTLGKNSVAWSEWVFSENYK